MSRFDEAVHAFISARFYVRLTETFGERGKAAFVYAVRFYAGQRGRRMAARVIRDGLSLTHAVYVCCGELTDTPEVGYAQREVTEISPDYVMKITDCPWYRQFKKMGCLEAGRVYCAEIDEALARGFNPAIDFQCEQTLNGADCCIHRVKGTYYDKKPEGLVIPDCKKGFDYHCGHLFKCYRQTCENIFGAEGIAIADAVLSDLSKTYGLETGKVLLDFMSMDFERI